MGDKAFVNADGDLLVVPEAGALDVTTELGRLRVFPGELFVLPRGLKMTVDLPHGVGRGWVCEAYNRHFVIPDRGPVGSNLLADRRHFLTPTAHYEDREVAGDGYRVWTKFGGHLHEYVQRHSPYDVVAWHGEYVPYKYPMQAFSPVGAVKVGACATSVPELALRGRCVAWPGSGIRPTRACLQCADD